MVEDAALMLRALEQEVRRAAGTRSATAGAAKEEAEDDTRRVVDFTTTVGALATYDIFLLQ